MGQQSYDVTPISTIANIVRPISQISTTDSKSITKPIRLYKERWFVAIVVSILQIISSIIWISYPPVANIAASYYDVSLSAINWLTQISFIMYLVFVFPAMWVLQHYGIRHVIYIISGCSIVGSGIRLFGNFEFVPSNYRFPITFIGQSIVGITFPFLMTLPTQISQSWFPEKQRTLSTSITSMTTYIGGLIGVLLPPYLSKTPSELYIMNDAFCIATIVLGCLGLFVRRSQPPTPPYFVSAIQLPELNKEMSTRKSFVQDLKTLVRSKHALLLAFAGGGVFGALPVIFLTLCQQMLCPAGYSNEFAAICGAILQGAGFAFSPLVAIVIGRTKRFDEAVKISLCLTLILNIALILIVKLPNMEIAIAVIVLMLGIATFTATPICMELGVEACYPVNEGMSGTLFWISGQIQSALFVPLITTFGQPLTPKQKQLQSCTVGNSDEAYDLTYSNLCATGIFFLETLAVFVWCRPKYKRMEAENLTNQAKPPTFVQILN